MIKLIFQCKKVGGGGLISGTLLAFHYLSPSTKIIAAEPELAADTYKSF